MKRKKITAWGIMAICLVLMQMAGNSASAQPLNLYADEDVLAEQYYQAAMDRTYEVIFVRRET